MDITVGIRRAIVEDIGRLAGTGRTNAVVQAGFLPASQLLRLHLGEIRLHREVGPRQVDGLLQINFRGFHCVIYSS